MEDRDKTRRTGEPSKTEVEATAAPAAEPETTEGAEGTDGTEGAEAAGSSQSPVEAIAGTIVSHLASVADLIARRVSPRPLTSLYELHPEARESSPRELGFRFVPLEDIRGTAVAGPAQRGEDYLPLPRFRGENWSARWRRIRLANERLAPLPPIDVFKFDGGYWVVDGHNRVAAALADHVVGLDAMVTELVPLDGQASELPTALLPYLAEVAEMRAAVAGTRPAIDIRRGSDIRAGLVSGTGSKRQRQIREQLSGGRPPRDRGTRRPDSDGASR